MLGGALGFLILTGIRGCVADKGTALARANTNQQAAIRTKLGKLKGAEGREKGRADALATKLEPALTKTVMWAPQAGFVLPEGDKSPALFYDSARRKAISAVTRHGERWNASLPSPESLGLPEQIDPAGVPEGLAKADLLKRVLTKVLDAGVRTVRSVDLGNVEYHERQGDDKLLRQMPVQVTFTGSIELLAKVLAEFQVEGSFLEVTTCTISRGGDKPGAGIEIDLNLQALSIVPKSAVPTGAAEQATKRPTRRNGDVRRFGRER